MRLTHLRLVQFRNHRHTDVAPGPGLTLFVGGNAQGKSALLEAVQVAATGRSFRARQDLEMIAFGGEWARVRAGVERGGRLEEIDIVLRREDGAGAPRVTRELRINGVSVRRGELFGHLRCVLAAPDDAEVVTGPPHRRRQVLDQLLAQISPAYYYVALRYGRVLAQRNRLLRLRGRGLEVWDEQLAALGARLTVRRRQLVDRLARVAAPVYATLCQGRERLVLEYRPSLRGEAEAALVEWAREALLRRRAEEAAGGATLVGPHRDDLALLLDGRDLRAYGSRGQQLTAMLALRLAERSVLLEETGEEPVLLLDDVFLTLDASRQAYLLESVRGVQTLMTVTTAPQVDLPPGALVYRIRDGAVEGEHAHLP
ncbi:MAG: DNA replication/repair protein RecF [Armatimonadota bacterium]|nr:DNA replication/repair protein RecF [Armatimonadota bacterium]MDR7451077.1 DNA replication/repair protein RecF [Armatimonadota bacterium]MDR7465902.1 DNA replication/repair protein RecF [Armatimonadota bacterium]MDR7493967.1 DNA replication/repair protein RecF [Armatimonadota bacterium]MDR7498417.1 DNA replication/repair protein RecF [Armatimonadota bacterium]